MSVMLLSCVGCYLETRRQFEVAFKMIDADRSDSVDSKEFSKVGVSVSVHCVVPVSSAAYVLHAGRSVVWHVEHYAGSVDIIGMLC